MAILSDLLKYIFVNDLSEKEKTDEYFFFSLSLGKEGGQYNTFIT